MFTINSGFFLRKTSNLISYYTVFNDILGRMEWKTVLKSLKTVSVYISHSLWNDSFESVFNS